jgi:hypothetical protein
MIRQDATGVYSGNLRDSNGNTVGLWACGENTAVRYQHPKLFS